MNKENHRKLIETIQFLYHRTKINVKNNCGISKKYLLNKVFDKGAPTLFNVCSDNIVG